MVTIGRWHEDITKASNPNFNISSRNYTIIYECTINITDKYLPIFIGIHKKRADPVSTDD